MAEDSTLFRHSDTGRLVAEALDVLQRATRTPGDGQVYFVYGGDRVKVGYTTDVNRRFMQLAHGSPVPVRMLGWIFGTRTDERLVLEALAHRRSHGEWHYADREVLAFVRGALDARPPYADAFLEWVPAVVEWVPT